MPIFTVEIDKRAVMAFSGNYSLKADWDALPFFNMLKRDLRESLFDPGTGKPIWDGITPITVRLATPAEVQTWRDSRVAEERDGTIEARLLRRLGGVSRAVKVVSRYSAAPVICKEHPTWPRPCARSGLHRPTSTSETIPRATRGPTGGPNH
jgi:hypothetical protein